MARCYLQGCLASGDLQSVTLNQAKETFPNLVPTTYEAASAYLREERKPKGEQDLLQEMCCDDSTWSPERSKSLLRDSFNEDRRWAYRW